MSIDGERVVALSVHLLDFRQINKLLEGFQELYHFQRDIMSYPNGSRVRVLLILIVFPNRLVASQER